MFAEVGAALFAGALLVSAGSARDKEPETLRRTEQWVANYDRDACHLVARFGTGDAMVAVRFTRYQPGTSFDLALYGKRMRSSDVTSRATLDFGLGGGSAAVGGVNGNAGKLDAVFFSGLRLDRWQRKSGEDVPPVISPGQEAAVTGVTVAIRGKRPFRLDFGSLGKPMEQMRACTTDLVRDWGYDPDVQASLTRPPAPIDSPQKWMSDSDYPGMSAALGHNGIVQFRLNVDAQGKVAGCFILARTSPDDFADITCRAMTRRARFTPALDAQGKPVRSFFISKIFWKAS